jgi:lipopolysaccharide export system permease protein
MIFNLPSTLSRYLARLYAGNLLGMAVILLGIIFLFDMVELLRRSARHDDIPFGMVLQMGLLKLPEMAIVIAPFIILFSALFTFWQLARRHELVVLRSSGISVWQFLAPPLLVAVVCGVFMVTALNPVSALFYSRYNVLESVYLDREQETVAIFDEGMWLRQDVENGYAVLHAGRIDVPDWRLHDVMVLVFNASDVFSQRIDADAALLKSGNWLLRDVVINSPGQPSQHLQAASLPTTLTPQDIEDSFSSPQAMGFWSLPSYIRTLDSTGFDSTRLRIHFQSLLSQPLLYAAMILLAATVALRPQRQGQSFMFIVGGILIGFVVFFMSNFLQALGSSHQIPVFLSAWSPAMISALLGVATLLMFEDG